MRARSVAAMLGFVTAASGLLALPGSPAGAAATARVDVGNASTVEGDSGSYRLVTFPVTVSDAPASPVTVSYHLMTGTASAPADFNDLGGNAMTLTLPAGKTAVKSISVKVYPDTTGEGDETFSVMVLSVTGGAVQGNTVATGTIVDDDPPGPLTVSVGDMSISEGDTGKNRVAKVWVNLSAPAPGPVSVHVMTMDADATAGSDYVATMKTISFAAKQFRKPFSFSIIPGTVGEADEQFHLMLSSPVNVAVNDDTAVITIVNDDAASSVTTETFLVGPFNLSALGTGAGSENDSSGYVSRPAGSFGIKTMDFDIVDTNGNPVDIHSVHLHHIVLLDWSQPDAVCPSYPDRFAGAGKERTPIAFGDDFAYKIEAADPQWAAVWHVMNMSNQARTVYIRYTIGYVPYNDALAARNVTPYWYDVTGPCTNSEYNVPGNGGSGSVYSTSRTFTAPHNGIRIGVGGHLHDGGIDITMRRVSDNSVICNNVANYPMPGMIHSITYCNNQTSVTAGEQFTTTARYDNSAPLTSVMGIQLNYVWET